MHSDMTSDRTLLQLYTEYGFKDRLMDITIGDLPPKSPEFCNMLPSLRPSPIFQSSKISNDDNADAFHVVPTTQSIDLDHGTDNDTYGNFLKHLEREDSRYEDGNFAFSPSDFEVPEIFMDSNQSTELFQTEDLQIYLPSEISPTPVDRLYSTLPGDDEPPKIFAFPCLDENTRLENFDLLRSSAARNNESHCVTSIKPEGTTASRIIRGCFENAPLSQKDQQKSKSDRYNPIKTDKYNPIKTEQKRREKQCNMHARNSQNKPTHNDIERQRRNDMKARFDALKASVPDIENLERTPKILVLSKATEFIGKLHKKEKQLDVEKEKERQRNRVLLERLVKLTNV